MDETARQGIAETIAIVTDTDCDLSPEELQALDIFCVPLTVTLEDGRELSTENTEENIETFFDHMETCKKLPKTSMPSPPMFAELYSRLALEGYTDVLVVPITGAMSGTIESARMGAQSSPIRVEIVDTYRNTLSLGLIVRYLAQQRANGATFAQLVQAAREIHPKVDIVFSVDSLKNLVKGGRTGKAVGLAAALLDIKPILTVDDDGEVVMLGKVRSMKRAIGKLADNAEDLVKRLGELEGYFVHVRNPQACEKLRQTFAERGIPFKELGIKQVGPIIATHVGLGTVGFAYIARDV